MDLSPRRRRAFATALAVVLAVESVSAVAAAARVATAGPAPAPVVVGTPAGAARVDPARAGHPHVATRPSTVVRPSLAVDPDLRALDAKPLTRAAPAREQTSSRSAGAGRLAVPVVRPHQRAPRARSAPARGSAARGPVSYRGRNHVWIPALGINRSVSWFPCDRSRAPDNYVYRWGCAGANNVYLLGHAYSVFEPLHDAYVGGRLRKGLQAVYADAKGRVHRYTVRWWKVVRPTTSASWAWAPQSVPSMTLQTCVGRNSEYRLMVRLVEVDG